MPHVETSPGTGSPAAGVKTTVVALTGTAADIDANAPSTAAVNASITAINAEVIFLTAGPKVDKEATTTNANARATDTLAAEALDAIDGAFPSVADAIEATSLGSIDANMEGTVDVQTCGKPGFHTLPEARLSSHMLGQAQAQAIASSLHGSTIQPDALAVDSLNSGDALATDALAAEALDATDGAFTTVADAIEVGLDSVTPSGFDSYVSTADSTVRKPGFQTASKAPLAMHIQASATTKCSTVTPSGIDSNTPSSGDSTVKGAGSASSVGGQCAHAPAPATAPSLHGPTDQPDIPTLESGPKSGKFIARLGLWQVRTAPISYPLPPASPIRSRTEDRLKSLVTNHSCTQTEHKIYLGS